MSKVCSVILSQEQATAGMYFEFKIGLYLNKNTWF